MSDWEKLRGGGGRNKRMGSGASDPQQKGKSAEGRNRGKGSVIGQQGSGGNSKLITGY